jgi:hypothetical protein
VFGHDTLGGCRESGQGLTESFQPRVTSNSDSRDRPQSHDRKVLGPDGQSWALTMLGVLPGGIFITAPSASLASVVGLMSRFTARSPFRPRLMASPSTLSLFDPSTNTACAWKPVKLPSR